MNNSHIDEMSWLSDKNGSGYLSPRRQPSEYLEILDDESEENSAEYEQIMDSISSVSDRES